MTDYQLLATRALYGLGVTHPPGVLVDKAIDILKKADKGLLMRTPQVSCSDCGNIMQRGSFWKHSHTTCVGAEAVDHE